MKLYKIVLRDLDGHEIVEFEYGESRDEALELALGRQGMSVSVKEAKAATRHELLEAVSRKHALA